MVVNTRTKVLNGSRYLCKFTTNEVGILAAKISNLLGLLHLYPYYYYFFFGKNPLCY